MKNLNTLEDYEENKMFQNTPNCDIINYSFVQLIIRPLDEFDPPHNAGDWGLFVSNEDKLLKIDILSELKMLYSEVHTTKVKNEEHYS